ncbi:MAG TPA: MFS transporter [Anaerolineales bacterium]|nr:MFS transporter [Anaerolineales bacterium]
MRKHSAYHVYLALQAASSFLLSMIFTASSVYQVIMAELTPLQLVLVGTTLEVTIFIFEIPTGVVADVFSRRLSVVIGWLLIGMGFIVEGSFPYFAPILLAQVLWGLGYTFTSGATEAWISDEIGESQAGKAFLRASQIGLLAALLGIFAGMGLGSIQVNLPVQLGGAGLVLVGVVSGFLMPETNFSPAVSRIRGAWKHMFGAFLQGLNLIRGRPQLMHILGIGFIYGLYSEGFDRLWTKHILDNFEMPMFMDFQPIVWIGIIRGAGMLLAAGLTEIARRKIVTDQFNSVAKALFFLTLLLSMGLFAFALGQSFWLVIGAYWLISVTRDIIGPVYTAWVNQRLDSKVRATVLSMSGQVDAVGQILGGPGVGIIGNVVSVRVALLVSGIILTPTLPLYQRVMKTFSNQGSVTQEKISDDA